MVPAMEAERDRSRYGTLATSECGGRLSSEASEELGCVLDGQGRRKGESGVIGAQSAVRLCTILT